MADQTTTVTTAETSSAQVNINFKDVVFMTAVVTATVTATIIVVENVTTSVTGFVADQVRKFWNSKFE